MTWAILRENIITVIQANGRLQKPMRVSGNGANGNCHCRAHHSTSAALPDRSNAMANRFCGGRRRTCNNNPASANIKLNIISADTTSYQ